MIYYDGSSYTMDQFANYQASGQDAASVSSDPLFVDAGNDDFNIPNTSPCVDAGTDVSVTDDIIGTQRPQGAKVDIGAFEYQVMEVAIEPPKNLMVVK